MTPHTPPATLVLYVLTAADVNVIARQRNAFGKLLPVCTEGNVSEPGDILPAIVIHTDHPGRNTFANLQVFLDGPGSYWAEAREFSDSKEIGTWHHLGTPDPPAPGAP